MNNLEDVTEEIATARAGKATHPVLRAFPRVFAFLLLLAIVIVFSAPDFAPWIFLSVPLFVLGQSILIEWLGVDAEPDDFNTGSAFWIWIVGVPVGYLYYEVRSGGDVIGWLFTPDGFSFLSFIFVSVAIAILVLAAYRWKRRWNYAGIDAENAGAIERISVLGASFHLGGYLIGIAAGVVATQQVSSTEAKWATFALAFLAGKLAIDLTAPRYLPMRRYGLGQALMRIATISPLWWGVPWAALVIVGSASIESPHISYIPWYVTYHATSVALQIIAFVTVCFCLLALGGIVVELADGKARVPAVQGDGWTNFDWVRVFLGVSILSTVELGIVWWTSDLSLDVRFPERTWTCDQRNNEYVVGWLQDGGTDIAVRGNSIDLFALTCSTANTNGCNFEGPGWESFRFLFERGTQSKTLSYKRGDEYVDSGFLHHSELAFSAALDVVVEMRKGGVMTLTVYGAEGETLNVLKSDLSRFPREYNVCAAHWREEARAR